MMTDLIALALASGAVIDVWFNGSLFSGWLGFFQVKAETPPPETPPSEQPSNDSVASDSKDDMAGDPLPASMQIADKVLPDWFATLMSCPFCLSYHVPFWLGFFLLLPAWLCPDPLSSIYRLPLYALAATRLGNLLNGALPPHLRYFRSKE